MVWNPWAEKAGQMGDLGGDNWPGWVAHIYTISTHDIYNISIVSIIRSTYNIYTPRFVCVEAGQCVTPVTLGPGQTWTAGHTLKFSK